MLEGFLRSLAVERGFSETIYVELKREQHGDNVVRAVAGMANAQGGIVLVGIDERVTDPDQCPGVPVSTKTDIANKCLTLLEPQYEPEIIAVAVPHLTDRVVLVVRVDLAEVPAHPLVLRGQVLVRRQSQTSPASRQELVGLVQAPNGSSERFPSSAMSLATTHQPQPGQHPQQSPPDLDIRVAGAIALRPQVAASALLGTALLANLQACVDRSAFSAWVSDRWLRGIAEPFSDWATRRRTSGDWVGERQADEASEEGPRFLQRVRILHEGTRLSYAVSLELRRAAGIAPGSVILSLEDLVRTFATLGSLVHGDIAALLPATLGAPALRGYDSIGWAAPRNNDLGDLLQIHSAIETRPSNAVSWAQMTLGVEQPIEAGLSAWLIMFLMDAGAVAPEAEAARLVQSWAGWLAN